TFRALSPMRGLRNEADHHPNSLMRFAGCAAKAATLTSKSHECPERPSVTARPWYGTACAPSRGADRMVGGSAALLLTARQSSTDVRMTMLWTLFVVLLLLWLLGVVSSYTLGGFILLLLVLAVVAVLVQLISGRRAVCKGPRNTGGDK